MDKHLRDKIEVLDTRLTDKNHRFSMFQPRLLSSQTPADVRLWKFEYLHEQTRGYPMRLTDAIVALVSPLLYRFECIVNKADRKLNSLTASAL